MKIDKINAIKKMLDGKKVGNEEWDPQDYVYYDKENGQFLRFFHSEDRTFELDVNSAPDDGWGIHPRIFKANEVYKALIEGTVLIHPFHSEFLIKIDVRTGAISIFNPKAMVPVVPDDGVSGLNSIIYRNKAVFTEYVGDEL